jgi:predicted alpha/beta-hydrolase family hydrolase
MPTAAERTMDLIDEPPGQAIPATVIVAHGAGGPMDTPFMNRFAEALAMAGFRVVRFEFPYMAARRAGHGQRAPDRTALLLAAWREAIVRHRRPGPLFVGGKSLGGRMASLIADDVAAAGLFCLGYPFHPPRRPDKPRVAHLAGLRTPTLILQGTRDPFGRQGEVTAYRLSPAIRLHWLGDGDHDFRPRRISGRSERQNLDEAKVVLLDWLADLVAA